MLRRRTFLVVLVSWLSGVFATLPGAASSRRAGAAGRNGSGLIVHKGWILRADDPR